MVGFFFFFFNLIMLAFLRWKFPVCHFAKALLQIFGLYIADAMNESVRIGSSSSNKKDRRHVFRLSTKHPCRGLRDSKKSENEEAPVETMELHIHIYCFEILKPIHCSTVIFNYAPSYLEHLRGA